MRFRGALFALLSVAILAACGGGGGGVTPPGGGGTPTPTPTPVPSATSVPASSSTAQPATVGAGGTSATITVPPASSGSGSIAIAAAAALPAGISPLARVRAASCTATFASFYVTFTPSADITLSAIPSFNITLPSSISTSGVNFYIAYLAPGASQWQEPALGPASVSGQTLTFTGTSGTVSMTAGSTYAFALYTEPSTCASPSPSPSSSSSPSSGGTLSGEIAFGSAGSTMSATISGSVATDGTISGTIAGTVSGTAFNGTVSGTASGTTASGTISGTGFTGTFTGPVNGNAFSASGTISFTGSGVSAVATLWGTNTSGGQTWWGSGTGTCNNSCTQNDQIFGGMAVDASGNAAFAASTLETDQGSHCVATAIGPGTFSGSTISLNETFALVIGTAPPCGAAQAATVVGSANAAFPSATSFTASGVDNNGNAFCFTGQQGATPAPCTLPSASPSSSPSGSPSPAPSPAVFTGGSVTQSCPSSGCTLAMNASDSGYTASTTWGANNAGASFNFTMSWATFAQIQGTFAPGALPSSIGTPLIYLDLLPATSVQFSQTPSMSVTTSTSFPGTQCGFAVYSSTGSQTTPQWNSMTAFGITEVTPSGSSFSVPATTLPPPNTVDFSASDQYVALYCR